MHVDLPCRRVLIPCSPPPRTERPQSSSVPQVKIVISWSFPFEHLCSLSAQMYIHLLWIEKIRLLPRRRLLQKSLTAFASSSSRRAFASNGAPPHANAVGPLPAAASRFLLS